MFFFTILVLVFLLCAFTIFITPAHPHTYKLSISTVTDIFDVFDVFYYLLLFYMHCHLDHTLLFQKKVTGQFALSHLLVFAQCLFAIVSLSSLMCTEDGATS